MTHLIFLAGASGRTEFWSPLIQQIHQQYSKQIIAYPGFGSEPKHPSVNNFEELTDHVLAQINQESVVIAQSMGGIFAIFAAIQKPQLIKGLVLMATSGGLDLSPFYVADWRSEYQKEFTDYPDWFVHAQPRLDTEFSQIQQKTLLLWGDDDVVSPVAVGEFLKHKIRNAHLEIIPDGDHQFAFHYPLEVAEHIHQYLASLD